jgi:eukaryotic-like serine/threonine-protein kinase
LNHPNLVQVYDFGEAAGRHYLVMELIEGQDLAEHIQQYGKMNVHDGLNAVEQAAHALKAACAKSIIHRDIKPSNLMLTRDGIVKVSDLGLAKILTDNTEVTATGVGMGSPHFIAPEQADDSSNVDHRVDIYALGITLLYLLTGKKPFDGSTPFSVVLAHVNKPLPSGSDLGTELPESVEWLISRMAAKKPEHRYQDYQSLIDDIKRVRDGEGITAPIAPTPLPAPGAAPAISGKPAAFADSFQFAGQPATASRMSGGCVRRWWRAPSGRSLLCW